MSQFLFSVFVMRFIALIPIRTWVGEKVLGRDQSLDSSFQFSRFAVETGYSTLDAIVLKNSEKPHSKRLILYCCSEDELAEGKVYEMELRSLAKKLGSHVLLWNYSGIGASRGSSSWSQMKYDCQQMLEVAEKGLQAEEIVIYGHGLGASVATHGVSSYRFKEGVRHLLIARSAPSSLAYQVGCQYGKLASFAVRVLGWNAQAQQEVPGSALAIHTAAVKGYQELERAEQIVPDGTIEWPESALGAALLAQSKRDWKVVGVREGHDGVLGSNTLASIAQEIHNRFYRSWIPFWNSSTKTARV